MAKLEEERNILEDIEAVRQYEAHEHSDLGNLKYGMRDKIGTAQFDNVLDETEPCYKDGNALGVIDHASQTEATELTLQEITEHTPSGITESFRQDKIDEKMQV